MLRSLLAILSPGGARARLSTLIFHRVVPAVDPLFPGEVDAAHFDAICGWLARWFHVLPLDEGVKRLREGTLPSRALAITFDDGYADNHDVAMPILARHRLPATFFIATGFLDGGRMWNDTVIESVRRCRAGVLDLRSLGIAGLDELALAGDAPRRAAIDAILGRIKYLPVDERLRTTERIASLAGVEPPTDLMMSSDQVRALRRAGLQIGAHTVTHPILATLDDDAARREIVDSKLGLEALIGEPVRSFAYPNGRPHQDFNERSVAIARDAGFDLAVTTAKGAAGGDVDPFRIPRFTPWDATRWRFGLRLAENLWSADTSAAAA